MGEYLTGEEVKKLIELIKFGDNMAWESLYITILKDMFMTVRGTT